MGYAEVTLSNGFVDEEGVKVCGYTFDEVAEVSLNDSRGVLNISDDGELFVFPWSNVAKINLKNIALIYENL